ncbi:PorP/SprF family type IX secretion system membrane protein [Mucilaginibacter sp.]|jgi:type IX secretion system PorP/SprF family membrane protein|uniref:PorP/SprF family type IX secretion system membrane protein n=1 Tax=Mucilaginibacter sp. TaxID=1882438 RepID=UPI00356A0A13
MNNKYTLIKPIIFLISLTLLLVTTGSSVMAQQNTFNYNQYADNLTPVNPAYSLLDKAGSINVLGRRQFVGIQGAPTSLLMSLSLPIESINASAGVFVVNDKFAVENQTEINAFFAKAIQLTGETYLSVSINAGIRNYVANYSTLDPSDPTFSNDVRETKPNIGFGVMFYGENYYIGVSVPELSFRNLGTASVLQANYLRSHYYFSAAFISKINDDINFKPATLVSALSGSKAIFNFSGTFYLKNTFGVGANYNTKKQLAGILSVNVSNFKVGYSYEFGTSSNNFGGFNNATNEVSLSYRFGKTGQNKLL